MAAAAALEQNQQWWNQAEQQQWEDQQQQLAAAQLEQQYEQGQTQAKFPGANSPPGNKDKAMSLGIVSVFRNCLEAFVLRNFL